MRISRYNVNYRVLCVLMRFRSKRYGACYVNCTKLSHTLSTVRLRFGGSFGGMVYGAFLPFIRDY